MARYSRLASCSFTLCQKQRRICSPKHHLEEGRIFIWSTWLTRVEVFQFKFENCLCRSSIQVIHHRYVSNQLWYKPSGEINKTSHTHTWVTASPGSITDLDDSFVMHAHTKPWKWTCCEDKHLLQVMLCNKSAPDKVTLWINPVSESLRKKMQTKKSSSKSLNPQMNDFPSVKCSDHQLHELKMTKWQNSKTEWQLH